MQLEVLDQAPVPVSAQIRYCGNILAGERAFERSQRVYHSRWAEPPSIVRHQIFPFSVFGNVNFTLAQYQIANAITHCQYLNRSPRKPRGWGPERRDG